MVEIQNLRKNCWNFILISFSNYSGPCIHSFLNWYFRNEILTLDIAADLIAATDTAHIGLGVFLDNFCKNLFKQSVIGSILESISEYFSFKFLKIWGVSKAQVFCFLLNFHTQNLFEFELHFIMCGYAEARHLSIFRHVYQKINQRYEIIPSTCSMKLHLIQTR